MIVREIKQNPEIIDNFDWFNDYKDTRSWAVGSCPELLSRLDEAYEKWCDKIREGNKKRYGGKTK